MLSGKSRLKGIGRAVAMCRGEDPNARFPKDINVLIEKGLITAEAFECPSDAHDGPSYFHYFPTKTPRWSSRAVMVCDVKGNHPRDGRAVCYMSGAVNFVSESEFQRLLARPENADFARAMKDAGSE
jgi:hypothetical protein